jgi:hypothetical protein
MLFFLFSLKIQEVGQTPVHTDVSYTNWFELEYVVLLAGLYG